MNYEERKTNGFVTIEIPDEQTASGGRPIEDPEDHMVTIVHRCYDEETGILSDKERMSVLRSEIEATRAATQRDLDDLNMMLADIDQAKSEYDLVKSEEALK